MTEVTAFPAYGGQENHATNNTMVMLRHVHRESSRAFEDLFRRLLETDNLSFGPTFRQQVVLSGSIPDGAIRQPAFDLFIEVKAGAPFSEQQARNHLSAIASECVGGRQAFLLVLTPTELQQTTIQTLQEEARAKGLSFASATFPQPLEALSASCAGHAALEPLVADYQAFLRLTGLLPLLDQIAVFPVGTSHDENVLHRVYYEPSSRPSKRGCRYVGFYRWKTITYLCDMGDAWLSEPDGEKISVTREGDSAPAGADILARIEQVITATTYYELRAASIRYYLFDACHETSFVKRSPYGILGLRYLRAGDYGIAKGTSAKRMAQELRGRVFD